jgi:hypothetical protein
MTWKENGKKVKRIYTKRVNDRRQTQPYSQMVSVSPLLLFVLGTVAGDEDPAVRP